MESNGYLIFKNYFDGAAFVSNLARLEKYFMNGFGLCITSVIITVFPATEKP